MNFIDPQFESLAESYLAIKDTIPAIDVYRKWSQLGYNPDASARAALLSSLSGNMSDAHEWALKAADQYRKGGDKSPLILLSILEVFVMNGMQDSAQHFTATVDTTRFNREQKILMEYLLQSDRIINNTSVATELNRLLEKIESLEEKKESWGYDFFELWLKNGPLNKEQKAQIQHLTNTIRKKIHS